jgi:hypothetical protein
MREAGKLYFTHCCKKRDDTLKGTGKKVSPQALYKSSKTQGFMKRCEEEGVEWAIFSDKYGFVFPSGRIEWYDKHSKDVSEQEKKQLFEKALNTLRNYRCSYFYYNPGRVHPLYLELVSEMKMRGINIQEITSKYEIVRELFGE